MRSVKIFVLGIIGLAAAFLLPAVQNYVLTAMALCPLVLLLAGQFYLPRAKRTIQVWFNPIVIEYEGELISPVEGMPLARLSGKELTFSFFKQWHDFKIITHRFWLLAGIGLSSLAAAGLAWELQDSLFGLAAFFYAMVSVWVFVILMAARWFWERRMLRLQGVSMGSFSVTENSRPPYRQVRYHFVDPEGHYRGGCFDSMFCDQADDMTIIFYDENNPDRSVPASALMFHKLVWKERPIPPDKSTLVEGV
jgi:hypothetical protein